MLFKDQKGNIPKIAAKMKMKIPFVMYRPIWNGDKLIYFYRPFIILQMGGGGLVTIYWKWYLAKDESPYQNCVESHLD